MFDKGFKELKDKYTVLRDRVRTLENQPKTKLPVEFDCPTCNHKTLAKRQSLFDNFPYTPVVLTDGDKY